MKKALSFFLTLLLAGGSISAMEKQAIFPIEHLPNELNCKVTSYAGILSPEAKGFFSGSTTYQNVLNGSSFSPDGKKLFITFNDHTAQLIDLTTNKVTPYQNVRFGSFSPDSQKLIVDFNDDTAQLIDLTTNKVTPYQNVRLGSFSPDSQKLIIKFNDDTAQLIDLTNNQVIASYKNVRFGLLSPDGKRLFISFNDYTAQLIDLITNQVEKTYQTGEATFSPDSKKLLICNYCTTQLIDLTNNQEVATYKNSTLGVDFSPDSKKLLIRFFNNNTATAQLIDLTTNKVTPYQNVRCGSFSLDSQRLFITFEDDTAQLIDLTTNKATPYQNVFCGSFSPYGKRLVITFKDDTAQLIDLELLNYLNNYLTVEQAFFLQQLYTNLSNGKIPNKDEHGEMVWQSLPQDLQQIIQHKINEIIRERNKNQSLLQRGVAYLKSYFF